MLLDSISDPSIFLWRKKQWTPFQRRLLHGHRHWSEVSLPSAGNQPAVSLFKHTNQDLIKISHRWTTFWRSRASRLRCGWDQEGSQSLGGEVLSVLPKRLLKKNWRGGKVPKCPRRRERSMRTTSKKGMILILLWKVAWRDKMRPGHAKLVEWKSLWNRICKTTLKSTSVERRIHVPFVETSAGQDTK